MSDNKQRNAKLEAGHLGGERLEVQAEYPEGVVVTNPDGKRSFIPADFLALLMMRQKGREG